ncbi:uncharacterized protein LOC133806946 [Humulus lupulus]|uniref:uncharacterized protein LOC133806946 n=1 Tax=Humulus lupulus TaxID=3486 RepID=UPI002B406453|nr:uncharacterized protein LOC133806946 [Humulus lupulus]
MPTFVNPPPFPSRLKKTKKEKVEKEILNTFCKVEVNIPLLETIKQVLRYAKFLKELCTNKRKLRGNEKVSVGENVSTVLQKKLPPKLRGSEKVTIPCTIDNKRIERFHLKKQRLIIQLVDRSNAYPRGIIEDVLVQVNELVFLAYFYVFDMEDESIPCSTPILLGRPFMKTARTKIDVHDSTLTMEFDGETIRFKAMRYPSEHLVLTDEDFSDEIMDVLIALNIGLDKSFKKVSFMDLPVSNEKLQPSIFQAPTLELKPLSNHLRYVYLGKNETLSVIIARNLYQVQEEKLIRVLQDYKTTIGWCIADIKGISPSMCMH